MLRAQRAWRIAADRRRRWLAGAGRRDRARALRLRSHALTSGVYRYGSVQAPGSRDVLFYKDGRTATVSVRRIPSTGGLTLGTNGKPDASLGPEWLNTQFRRAARAVHARRADAAVRAARRAGARAAGARSGRDRPRLGHDVARAARQPDARARRHDRDRAGDDQGVARVLPGESRVRSTIRGRRSRSTTRAPTSRRARKKFDLIVSEPSNPWVSGVSGLFTTEFYGRVKTYLTPTACSPSGCTSTRSTTAWCSA